MPRPPPGLWAALRVAYREGLSRLSGGAQAPAHTVRDLNYRQATAKAFKHVINSVAKPVPAAIETVVAGPAPVRSYSALRPPFDLATRSFSTSFGGAALRRTTAAPLRRGAHLGGSPAPFRSSLPKTAQVGLQLHARGLHAGPARQVFQNVVENAPLGVRSLWEVEWKQQKSSKRGLKRSQSTSADKENRAEVKSAKVAKLPILQEIAASEDASTAAFDRFFPTAPIAQTSSRLGATSLLYVPLSLPSIEADWTDVSGFSSAYSPSPVALSHPLLPPPVLRALRSHSDSSHIHGIRLRSLFDRLSSTSAGDQVKDAWIQRGNELVLRVDRALAEELAEGRLYWLRVEDEAPRFEDTQESPTDRIRRWRRSVEPPSSSMSSLSIIGSDIPPEEGGQGLDYSWAMLDTITHDRVASRVILPVLQH